MSIRDRILARRDLDQLRADRDITGLAAALNAEGVTVVKSRFVTARTVMAECADGVAILSTLKAAVAIPAVEWAVAFLGKDSGIDIGNPVTQGMVDQLAAGGALSADQAGQLKALALQPDLVTQDQVAVEMYNPDGTEK